MRGRKAERPRWWARGGGGYFVTFKGKKHLLAAGPKDEPDGPCYLAALDSFSKMLRQEHNKGNDGFYFTSLCNEYRVFLTAGGRKASLNNFTHLVKPFAVSIGNLPISQLKPHHIRTYLQGRTTWGDNTKRLAHKLLMGVLNWGVKEGLVSSNPLKGRMETPEEKAKGKEARLSPEMTKLLIDNAEGDFKKYLQILDTTGCRPEEAAHMTAKQYHDGAFVYPWNAQKGTFRHKQARRGKKIDRVIFLTPEMQQMVSEQVKAHPAAYLFTTTRGKPFAKMNRQYAWATLIAKDAIVKQMRKEKIDPATVVPYSFRHSRISQFVEEGMSIAIVAQLVGNSVSVIEKFYSHPDPKKIRDIYLSFMK